MQCCRCHNSHVSKSGVAGLLGGILLGAGFMYWGDPKLGRRRRARTRDKLARLRRLSGRAFRRVLGRVDGKVTGVLARSARLWSPDGAPDCKVRDRVRSRLGRLIERPVEVMVARGRVFLKGHVSSQVMDEVKRVPGVARVEQPSVTALREVRQA